MDAMRAMLRAAVAGLALCTLPSLAEAAELSLSHQYATSDVRHQVAQALADELADADVGVDLRIHPASSLLAPEAQYDALRAGRLDMAVMPLAYAAREHPAFGLTILPGIVRNHAHAARVVGSDFMRAIEAELAEDGLMVLVHGFLAQGVAARGECMTAPEKARGKRVRAAAGGVLADTLAAAGATVVQVPTGQVYEALQEGTIDAASSSTSVLAANRLYEQVACYTPPGEAAPSVVYQPVLMRRAAYEALTSEQRAALDGARVDAATLYREEAERQDKLSTEAFRKAGVAIREMLPEEFEAWRSLARRSAARMIEERKGDASLVDLAFAVE